MSTKLNSYSVDLTSGRYLVPDVQTYVRSAVFTLGKSYETTGYWAHAIQVGFMDYSFLTFSFGCQVDFLLQKFKWIFEEKQNLSTQDSSCKSGPNRLQARFLESNISLVQNRNSIVLPLTFQRYQSSLPFQLNHFSISSHLISVCLFKNVSGDDANVHWWEDSKAFPKWILCTAWTASESFLSHISYN